MNKSNSYGLIPGNWEEIIIDNLVNLGIIEKPIDGNHGNIHPTASDYVKEGIPFVMANNVHDGILDLSACNFIRKEQADKLQKGFSISGDILFTHKGTVGSVAIVGEIPFDYIMLTPQVTYYRIINENKLDRYFLKSFFEGEKFQSILNIRSGGGTRAYIGITNQRDLPILLPPLSEQKAIASCLRTWDEAIQKTSQLITQKELRKKWLMQQLLTGKKRLKGFSGEWKEYILSEVVIFLNGKAYKQEELLEAGKYKVLRVGNFFSNSNWYYSDLELEEDKYVHDGDLMYAWSASFGPRFWTGEKTIYHYHIWKVIPKELAIKHFLFYYLVLDTEKIFNNKQGGTMFHITKGDMEKRRITLPSIQEQNAISNILQIADKEIELLKSKLWQLKEQKKGLMQVLLTGKKRLKIENQ